MIIKINGQDLEAIPGETLMELAERNQIEIPSLCHKKGFEGLGRCRMCLVEVKNGTRKEIVASCQYPVREGIEVIVHTDELQSIRRDIVMMLAIRSPDDEYVMKLAEKYDAVPEARFVQLDKSDPCILCGLCVEACAKLGTHAISMVSRGIHKKVSTPFDDPSLDCIGCGACAFVCPIDAIQMSESDGIRTIWNRTFDLVRCERCGKYYATKEELDYVQSLTEPTELDGLCESCKRLHMKEQFKDVFKNIY